MAPSSSARSKSRGLLGAETLPSLAAEPPVREEKRMDCSSSDSDLSFHFPRMSYSGKKVEPVRPFSVSAADFREGRSPTPDLSDVTVYNEIAKMMPDTQKFPEVKMSGRREPTPGSEGEQQYGRSARPLFAELKQRQQDSGFHSPFNQHS